MSADSWISIDPAFISWLQQIQARFDRIDEERLRGATHAAGKHYVRAIKDRIERGPDTNGTLHSEMDFRDVIPHLRTWDEKDSVVFGVPTENPASDRASWMEWGDEDQPPTPVLFAAVHNQELRQRALQEFYQTLMDPHE